MISQWCKIKLKCLNDNNLNVQSTFLKKLRAKPASKFGKVSHCPSAYAVEFSRTVYPAPNFNFTPRWLLWKSPHCRIPAGQCSGAPIPGRSGISRAGIPRIHHAKPMATKFPWSQPLWLFFVGIPQGEGICPSTHDPWWAKKVPHAGVRGHPARSNWQCGACVEDSPDCMCCATWGAFWAFTLMMVSFWLLLVSLIMHHEHVPNIYAPPCTFLPIDIEEKNSKHLLIKLSRWLTEIYTKFYICIHTHIFK